MKNENHGTQSLTWETVSIRTTIAMVVCGLLSLIMAIYQIFIIPDGLIPHGILYWLAFCAPIFLFIKYVLSHPQGKMWPLSILGLIACLWINFNLPGFMGASLEIDCYSHIRVKLKTTYQCICQVHNDVEDYRLFSKCEFTGMPFSPFVRQSQSVEMEAGRIRYDGYKEEIFQRSKPNGDPYESGAPKTLQVIDFNYAFIGYINFQYLEQEDLFEVFFMRDVMCPKYYTDTFVVKELQPFSITLCGREYKLIFFRQNNATIVRFQ